MRTVSVRKEDVERKWLVVDAEGKVLGRMASQVATILRGKHKPFFTPHVDCGDFVIVVNADKVRLTGKKLLNKSYYFHSNYPGGLKTVQAGKMLEKSSQKALWRGWTGASTWSPSSWGAGGGPPSTCCRAPSESFFP